MATYVMSDIHGHRALFHKMLDKIGFSSEDTLYIIGDVCDRGPEPIPLLQEIMAAPNMVFLMGNHEDILLRYINLYGYGVNMRTWELLGNRSTLNGFNALDEALQREIGAFLQNAPIHATVTVNDRDFYLVHAFPGDTREEELWSRPQGHAPNPLPGKQVILGHTPTIHMDREPAGVERYEGELFWKGKHMRIYREPGLVGIDCGCGTFSRVGALACLRLEDMEEFYVPMRAQTE